MKLKAQQVFDATLAVSQIIRDNRPMPTKAAYRLARLHAKLLPEFQTLTARRDEMIKAYDHHPMILVHDYDSNESVPKTKENPLGQRLEPSAEFSVPADKLPEFNAAWKEIGDQEIEVDVEPVPLSCFDLGASMASPISASEFVILGDLVKE